jgi:hypothetical protein
MRNDISKTPSWGHILTDIALTMVLRSVWFTVQVLAVPINWIDRLTRR